MLRRDAEASGSDGSSIIPPLEKAWEFRAGGAIESAPAVAYGIVFFGSKDKHIYAVDVDTGKSRWTFKMEKAVVTTPVVADGIVYAASKDKHIYAIDARTGEKHWQFSPGNDISATAVGHGLVFFGCKDKQIYALDAKTGQQQWTFKGNSKGYSAPIITDGKVLISGNGGNLYALNATDGKLHWERQTRLSDSIPVVAGDYILCRTAMGALEVTNLTSGASAGKLLLQGVVEFSVNKGLLFITFNVPKGLGAYSLRKVGSMDTSFDILYPVGKWVTVSLPVVGGDYAYMASLGGKYLLSMNLTKVMKRYEFPLDYKLKSPPVISNNMLFVGGDKGQLLALRSTDDPQALQRLEHIEEIVVRTPTFAAIIWGGALRFPKKCCLCCGPAEEFEKISFMEHKTRTTISGVPYCKACKQKVKKTFGGEKPGVGILQTNPAVIAFRSMKYWVMFMEANHLR